jgi:ribosomal protein S18 acetylase RimI-like enzyme
MAEAPCKFLDWDSRFFGHRIARVERNRLDEASMAEALDWCREHRIDCLYFLCAPDDDRSVRLAEAEGFHLVDVRLELSRRLDAPPDAFDDVVRSFQPTDFDALLQIASEAYRDTRFWYDGRFTREQAASLYREWIAKSCRDDEKQVLVFVEDGQVKGFVTCSFEAASIGRIGLFAVASEARGAGVGRALVGAALAHCYSDGGREIRVVTQARNIGAQRLYQACGFRTLSMHLWYHKWSSAIQADCATHRR